MGRYLKLCHTSDWHLGHSLHGHSREHEHRAFLTFLLDLLAREEVDALVVAGDVFDSANPPASAQAMFYSFLAEARTRLPRLNVVVIAGNHDSAARLSAPDPLLRAHGVRVVGAVPRRGPSSRDPIDGDALVVPLHGRNGEVAAWVAAVPYLRAADLPALDEGESVANGVRRIYDAVLGAARARRRDGQALIATGHLTTLDTTPSEQSERAILVADKNAVGADLFGADVTYAALGHLHLAQAVGDREHLRYSGSPIPLAMSEANYPHQVRLVRFERGRLAGQDAVRVPRAVDVLRVPEDGPGELDAVLGQLERLELREGAPREAWPYLEVRVRLGAPVPDLRARIEAALGDRPVRLVKIGVERPKAQGALAEQTPRRELADLDVEDVFRRCYARSFEGEPSPELLDAFAEVAEAARRRLEEQR
ncbi:MAG TPA: exonuclease SbcCD subunit D C-terminal domain-containing protein [Sandaracinaceae bacterium]